MVTAIGALCSAAERKSWNKVQYIGGTLPIKTSPYDWNTTVTITSNPDSVVLTIAPSSVFGHQQTVRIKPSQITAVVSGPGAWQRVADVSGSHLPSKRPTLFGLLLDYAFIGILYQNDDGKPAAILLNSVYASSQIGRVLEALTGKPLVYAK
ncbi:MAG: hypothetical protein WCB12_17605 [Bryobacteraceae bacterium]